MEPKTTSEVGFGSLFKSHPGGGISGEGACT